MYFFKCRQPLQMLPYNLWLVSSLDLNQNYIFVHLPENGFIVSNCSTDCLGFTQDSSMNHYFVAPSVL